MKKWSKKYKDSIDCNNPKGFSQKAHCQGKKEKEETVLEMWFDEAEKRVPRKYKSQDPKQHSDLYTDENPRGTIKGLGFVDSAKAKQSINKIKNSGKEHKHKMQVMQCTKGQEWPIGQKIQKVKRTCTPLKSVQGVH